MASYSLNAYNLWTSNQVDYYYASGDYITIQSVWAQLYTYEGSPSNFTIYNNQTVSVLLEFYFAPTGKTQYKTIYFHGPTVAYTVTWQNWDGTVLETDYNVPEGATPSYDGSTPSRASTAQYSYTFTGWSPSVGAIYSNTTYTAQFSANIRSYVVSASVSPSDSGSVSGTGTYSYGTSVSLTATPAEGFTFVKWSDDTTTNPKSFTVTGPVSLTAYFKRPAIKVKVNGNWVDGITWVKVNGNWVKAKRIYVNDNGTWKESR